MPSSDPLAKTAGPTPEDRAAEWVARLRAEDCSSDDWEHFCEWRSAESDNDVTFARYMDRWADLGELAEEPEIVRMRLEAMGIESQHDRRPAWLMPFAASMALTIATGLLVVTNWNGGTEEQATRLAGVEQVGSPVAPRQGRDSAVEAELAQERFTHAYRSAVGQRSKIDLPDGSTVELNTDTVIEVEFTPQRREFRLVRGEALFDVEPDASRPFIVNSDGERVIALGTVFSVRKIAGELVVSLFEGEVQVERLADLSVGAKAVRSARLDAGQQLVTGTTQEFQVSPLDGEAALGWRTGRLVFDGDRLKDVVTELNRYSVRKLALGDPELGKLKVSGTFRTGSAEAFASALSVALPVSVESERESGKIVLYAAN